MDEKAQQVIEIPLKSDAAGKAEQKRKAIIAALYFLTSLLIVSLIVFVAAKYLQII